MLMAKEMQSTAPVEINVEIYAQLWKIPLATELSTFPQGDFPIACGNVENFNLNSDIQGFSIKPCCG